MYLMAQYFRHKEGRKSYFEFSGLKNIFANMHLLNIMIAERIKNATQTDSLLNAVIQLDTFLGMMPFIRCISVETGPDLSFVDVYLLL